MILLLLGSGGREHAFAWKLSQSPLLTKLYIAPGNSGTAQCGENVALNPLDFEAIQKFVAEHKVDLVLPGNEDPLVAGIADALGNAGIAVAGPDTYASALEGSKDFAKAFMHRHNIPTAAYKSFSLQTLAEGKQFLSELKPPYVLKADGLAAGKGVIITPDLAEAQTVLDDMLAGGRFGAAGSMVVVEEFLHGIEISCFVVSDGEHWQMLGSAKDYKRIGEGDTGPNTGGMGAISPVPFADEEFMQKVQDRIVLPTLKGLREEGHPFRGFLFVGLMNCGGDPRVIEYNVRMGDPETEAIFPRLNTDMVQLVHAIAHGNLDKVAFSLNPQTAATVFLVSAGYPGEIQKGYPVHLPAPAEGSVYFHAGMAEKDGSIVTNGGRVLAITSLGPDIITAVANSLTTAERVTFEGKTYRRDIGQDLM
ncbi:MAG: phosphoribosylamine--glycine ligase [Bacteroidetes bacterium]|nr:phosphoribosylamine--glycine ligase [Bacteroidota bacterium]